MSFRSLNLLVKCGASACFFLFVVSCATSPAAGVSNLRVCADPNNLPFSNDRLEGFENKIADILAHEMKKPLRYTWWAQRRGFVRNTLNAGVCDVVMGVPADFEMTLTTSPYYRSTYAFVSLKDRALNLHSFDDAQLRRLLIGIPLVGEDFADTPPAHLLVDRGIVNNIRGFTVYGDYSRENPSSEILEAVEKGTIDVAIVWGPIAGYFASRQNQAMDVVPATTATDTVFPPLTYDISMGVRKTDAALRDELNRVLSRQSVSITGVLDSFGVPRVAAVSPARHRSARE